MKTSKTELCAKRAQAWEDCKNFLESHRQKDGTLTAEDKKTYDKMVETVDALKAEIKNLEACCQSAQDRRPGNRKSIQLLPQALCRLPQRSSHEERDP